jgi:hypothetical protein
MVASTQKWREQRLVGAGKVGLSISADQSVIGAAITENEKIPKHVMKSAVKVFIKGIGAVMTPKSNGGNPFINLEITSASPASPCLNGLDINFKKAHDEAASVFG